MVNGCILKNDGWDGKKTRGSRTILLYLFEMFVQLSFIFTKEGGNGNGNGSESRGFVFAVKYKLSNGINVMNKHID